jgi:multiple antibiotic resistance protein
VTASELALLAFTSFITLVNPFGIMPVFISMTSNLDVKARRSTAIRGGIVAFLILLLFALAGQFLFAFFGISVNSFRMVGGIIFFTLGYDMLQARLSKIRVPEDKVDEYIGDISITPLAIPMITGPGSITNAIVLMEDADTIWLKTVLVIVMFSVILLNTLALLFAANITKWLGVTGNKVMMRLMGLIVMVIAVEFFFSGLGPMLRSILGIEL